VYVVHGGETVERREIALGAREVGYVEVANGVSPGDTIVVDGLMNLKDGAAVQVRPSAARDVSSGNDTPSGSGAASGRAS
jgi:multidrug efflux pump subunit AcrA (membrane-fusion protein)